MARNYSFLVAEPDFALREAEAKIINEMGYPTVVEVTNGTEAWAYLRRRSADIVVASWNMPEMSGLALLKVVRSEPEFMSLPFFLVTSEVTKAQVIEAGEAGVSDVLLRPFTPEAFKHKIETFLRPEADPQALAANESYHMGLELMAKESWKDAIDSFQEVLKIYDNAEVHYNLGYIKTAQGHYDEALTHFRRATQINNAFAQAYEKMGECYLKLGRHEEAQAAFEKAAEIYFEKHMDENAEAVLREVLKINPNTLNVYNSLGIIYRRQGLHDEAIDMYKRAMKVSPKDENIHFNLARAFLEIGERLKARNILRQCIRLHPKFVDAQTLLKSVEAQLPPHLR